MKHNNLLNKGYWLHVDNQCSSQDIFHRQYCTASNVCVTTRLNEKHKLEELGKKRLHKGEAAVCCTNMQEQ
jgi:hypothetical protein